MREKLIKIKRRVSGIPDVEIKSINRIFNQEELKPGRVVIFLVYYYYTGLVF